MTPQEIASLLCKTVDGPGRGHKQCSNCNVYVGVRTKSCKCGHVFVTHKTKQLTKIELLKVENAPTDEEILYTAKVYGTPSSKIVYTPCGPCPIVLDDRNYTSICDFCNTVVNDGVHDNKIYLPEAIKFFVRQFLEYNSKKYKVVCQHIDQWYKELMNESAT